MQSTGIVRKLDSLGRITLPMELRKSFDIGDREPLEIFTEDDKIIIKKYNPSDIFTGQCEDLMRRSDRIQGQESIPGFHPRAGPHCRIHIIRINLSTTT